MRAVVVDFPLVPVIAISGHARPDLARSRQNNSISPITSTLALRARFTVQCGSGCVSGTPGASTSAAMTDQSISRRFCVFRPAARASEIFFCSSSKATTSAPPSFMARAASRPELPRPKTATLFPANVVTGIKVHLNLSVARPASASTTATIQKRITICGSVQPSCS